MVILAAINRGDKSAYSALSAQARCLNLMHAGDLLESQGLHSLNEFVTGLSTRKDASKAVRDLAADLRVQRIATECRKALQAGVEHPKFARAKGIVGEAVAAGQKVIVFAHYRDSVDLLQSVLNTSDGVRAAKLVGKAGGGMSQKEQAQVVQDFRSGLHNVLVASSVAEEGLDIPSVDLVLFFEPVPSEVRSIQRRGRAGRVKAGLTRVLIAKGTKDEAIFWISRRREELMHQHMSDLSLENDGGPKAENPQPPKGKLAGTAESQKNLNEFP
jgi:Fanconi anemia group M protein